jgi:chemotaxis signal transduction protein
MVFRVGGRLLATPAADIAGVRSCSVDLPIPSRTPFLRHLVRDGDQVLPVYDLAGRLNLHAVIPSLYIIAKHRLGPMAVRVDGEMPTVHQAQPGQISPSDAADPDVLGTFFYGSEAAPIYSFVNLGGSGDTPHPE